MLLAQMNESLISALHDSFLAVMPEGAAHDAVTCPLCQLEGGQLLNTYSEEEVAAKIAAAVSSATADLATKVADLEGAAASSEVETKVAEAKAESEAKVAELQSALEAKEIEAQAEKERADKLESDIAAAAEKVTQDARRDARVAEAKEAGGFGEEFLTANADRFAAMSDEDFAASVAGWAEARSAALAAAAVDPSKLDQSKVPATTALTATQDDVSRTKATGPDLIRELAAFQATGTDVRRVH